MDISCDKCHVTAVRACALDPVMCPQLSLSRHHHHSWEVSIRLATTTPTTALQRNCQVRSHAAPLCTPQPSSFIRFTNISLFPAVPLIQNEYVDIESSLRAIVGNIESVQRLTTFNSQGYFELRQAPQQDSHSVPSLWLVFPIIPRFFSIHPSGPTFARFSTKDRYELELSHGQRRVDDMQ